MNILILYIYINTMSIPFNPSHTYSRKAMKLSRGPPVKHGQTSGRPAELFAKGWVLGRRIGGGPFVELSRLNGVTSGSDSLEVPTIYIYILTDILRA